MLRLSKLIFWLRLLLLVISYILLSWLLHCIKATPKPVGKIRYPFATEDALDEEPNNDKRTIRILSFNHGVDRVRVNMTKICNLPFDCEITYEGNENLLPTNDYKAIMVFGRAAAKSDYVTEKFPNALINYAIPIVNGWRETYEENLPGSFIHVSDFKSTSDLASYLGYLLRNETAYFEYFRWREQYQVSTWNSSPETYNKVNCEVCTKLNKTLEARKEGVETIEVIKDLGETFLNLQTCVNAVTTL
ncbi:4-galactosyl-N-acetylglucosaminide 3-alpha-L-fucosyltransferase 9-like isoform X2 [Convolutriloba macropyga]|uniref:4-galactosyl-N-acetylglucosaminide 3-alpha-L-fucosyltransferase 9-like isoform X2 n=1 Tax=Convolutriloba macropyga TaxID=536237 RepID=UPI003F52501D